MLAYMNFHCLFISASSQACSCTAIVFREQGASMTIYFSFPQFPADKNLYREKKKNSMIFFLIAKFQYD